MLSTTHPGPLDIWTVAVLRDQNRSDGKSGKIHSGEGEFEVNSCKTEPEIHRFGLHGKEPIQIWKRI